MTAHDRTDDEATLHRLGYAQVLYRADSRTSPSRSRSSRSSGWYLLSARNWFTGPVREAGSEEEPTDIERQLEAEAP